MKQVLFLLSFMLLFACGKEEPEPEIEKPPKPYMKSVLPQGDDCGNDFHINFKMGNKQYSFSASDTNTIDQINYVTYDTGIDLHSYYIINKITKEEIFIRFYFTKWDYNALITADYFYADPWRNQVGVNVELYIPEDIQEHTYYLYLGRNNDSSYFYINYIDKDHICGSFKTIFKECCGGDLKEYDTEGEFIIPNVR